MDRNENMTILVNMIIHPITRRAAVDRAPRQDRLRPRVQTQSLRSVRGEWEVNGRWMGGECVMNLQRKSCQKQETTPCVQLKCSILVTNFCPAASEFYVAEIWYLSTKEIKKKRTYITDHVGDLYLFVRHPMHVVSCTGYSCNENTKMKIIYASFQDSLIRFDHPLDKLRSVL